MGGNLALFYARGQDPAPHGIQALALVRGPCFRAGDPLVLLAGKRHRRFLLWETER